MLEAGTMQNIVLLLQLNHGFLVVVTGADAPESTYLSWGWRTRLTMRTRGYAAHLESRVHCSDRQQGISTPSAITFH